ncbi:MAG: universal stress protein [Ornithinimicrobium sp.]
MSIVVGYVPTREGRAALDRAAQEAVLRGLKLIVVKSPRSGRAFGATESSQLADQLVGITESLDQEGIAHEVRVLEGREDPSEDLIAVAEDTDADCIVIGLRRRSKVGKLFLGSNAQRVLLDAACPVLAVKAPEQAW